MKIRNNFPGVAKSHQKKKKISQNTDSTYLWELVGYLATKGIKVGKFVKVGKLNKLPEEYKTGTYLLNFRHHVAVLKDNIIYDNQSWNGLEPQFYEFKDDLLDGVATLTKDTEISLKDLLTKRRIVVR